MKNIKGLVLAEALVAVSTLATGAIVLSTIVTNALTATQISEDYMIAQNLVTESIEGLKSIRDTNWLLKPGKADCWLALGVTANDDPTLDCQNKAKIEFGKNYVISSSDSGWALATTNQNPNLQAAAAAGALNQNADYLLYVKDGQFTTSAGGAAKSKFYRSLTSEVIKPDFATFEAKIQWNNGKKVYTIKREFSLYNYKQ